MMISLNITKAVQAIRALQCFNLVCCEWNRLGKFSRDSPVKRGRCHRNRRTLKREAIPSSFLLRSLDQHSKNKRVQIQTNQLLLVKETKIEDR